MDATGQLVAHFFRQHSGKMVASLARVFGMAQLDNILDAVQDTFETAMSHWRYNGMPADPPAWLSRVARNKLINIINRAARQTTIEAMEASIVAAQGETPPVVEDEEAADSQVQLLVACCHPALGERDRILTTLHVLCGFGVPELANALRLNREVVKKALQRSKSTLRRVNIQLDPRAAKHAAENSATVCTILYLMFNEGYKATRDAKGINMDLCYEAMRLAKLLRPIAPPAAEVDALLALMFFHSARFPARIMAYGEWVPLAEQDRRLWDRRLIAEGFHYLECAKRSGCAGKYYLESLIASLHCAARHFAETDWKAILGLYRLLEGLEPSSVLIRLNRLVAESYAAGPLAVITELEAIPYDADSGTVFLLQAVKAHVYQRAGSTAQAHIAYRAALSLAQNPLDAQYIQKQLNTLYT
ncbi:RNA polymerase sigma-70 factor, ECF subfamily [Parapedobacter luteus]|uniref:RNA polymerase sigma-70 factor, ECF subfamily n=1 Tax=Parapedobacter luteus TaxID=623280 RepID=A0A1T5CFN9_9SPHI|nr:sigma-70 family RNA polymerase sigma factor [Parapedobacter luteus]SKB57920.1 RNA polymerase sigma-70 factor, ECF subfamily [Parapedobacter luteus]